MVRPRKHRCCHHYQGDRIYKPQGVPMSELEVTEVALDAFEALRLCDAEGLDQTAAGKKMGVSRGTVQRLVRSARQAVATALVEHKALVINLKLDQNQED